MIQLAKEGVVEVKLAATGFRTQQLSDENSVVVTVQSTSTGPAYYVGRRAIAKEEMADVTLIDVSERSNRWFAEVVEDESPFAHRWEVASSKSLEQEITRQLSVASPRHYQPSLREDLSRKEAGEIV